MRTRPETAQPDAHMLGAGPSPRLTMPVANRDQGAPDSMDHRWCATRDLGAGGRNLRTAARSLGLAGLLITAVVAPGCMPNGGGGVDTPGEIPAAVDDFLKPDDIAALIEVGATVHKGSDPPAIEAVWSVAGLTIRSDDLGQTGAVVPYTFTFYDQLSDGSVKVSYTSTPPVDTADGVGSFISGAARCFSVYVDSRGTANGCVYRSPQILSACLNADDDALNWEIAFLMKEKSGENCDALVPEGHRRLLRTDLVSARVGGSEPDPDEHVVAELEATCGDYCARELACSPEEYPSGARTCEVECITDIRSLGAVWAASGCIAPLLRYSTCREALSCADRDRHQSLETCDASGQCTQWPLAFCETEFCAVPAACGIDSENRCGR